jgi:hypothetical protein
MSELPSKNYRSGTAQQEERKGAVRHHRRQTWIGGEHPFHPKEPRKDAYRPEAGAYETKGAPRPTVARRAYRKAGRRHEP